MPRTFSKDALVSWLIDGIEYKLTDHNRSELSVDVERIGETQRMANGTLRQFVIADKRTFSVSWEDLPFNAANTVDGFFGGREIEAFYDSNPGVFTLIVREGDVAKDGEGLRYNVVITDFSKSIKKRGAYDFWDVDLTMEQV